LNFARYFIVNNVLYKHDEETQNVVTVP